MAVQLTGHHGTPTIKSELINRSTWNAKKLMHADAGNGQPAKNETTPHPLKRIQRTGLKCAEKTYNPNGEVYRDGTEKNKCYVLQKKKNSMKFIAYFLVNTCSSFVKRQDTCDIFKFVNFPTCPRWDLLWKGLREKRRLDGTTMRFGKLFGLCSYNSIALNFKFYISANLRPSTVVLSFVSLD